MTTPDDHKRLRFQGRTVAAQMLLGMAQHGVPLDHTESYAAGLIEGIRDFITANRDERAAYELVQRAADAIDHPALNEKPNA